MKVRLPLSPELLDPDDPWEGHAMSRVLVELIQGIRLELPGAVDTLRCLVRTYAQDYGFDGTAEAMKVVDECTALLEDAIWNGVVEQPEQIPRLGETLLLVKFRLYLAQKRKKVPSPPSSIYIH